jgi:hypothetical protein
MRLVEKAADILERGADAWESDTIGWFQGGFGNLTQGFCALGMCRYQLVGKDVGVTWTCSKDLYDVYWNALDGLGKALNGAAIDDWNDAPERTKEEVVELFKQAAKDLRNRA